MLTIRCNAPPKQAVERPIFGPITIEEHLRAILSPNAHFLQSGTHLDMSQGLSIKQQRLPLSQWVIDVEVSGR